MRVAQAGLLITVFAVGMVVGAPTMAVLTRRMPPRTTLMLALLVFAGGHLVVALGSSFVLLLAARFVTAVAAGRWSVASVAATRAAGPGAGVRALGLVGAGGMLANVVGVPLGAFTGQLSGWRGPFWALAALSLAAVALIARSVPHEARDQQAVSLRSELAALRSGRLWLVLAACATTTGGVLSVYSYISPLLTDRAGMAVGLVPLVLVGFGVASLIGTVYEGQPRRRRPARDHRRRGRRDDGHPPGARPAVDAHRAHCGARRPARARAARANPVLTSLAVRFAGVAPTLGVAMSVSAYNLGTAVGSSIAGVTLGSSLGATGPAVVGAVIAAITLLPAVTVARVRRVRSA